MQPSSRRADMTTSESEVATSAEARQGLSSERAAALQAQWGRNEIAAVARAGWWETLLEVLREPMFLLLLGASAVYLALGDRIEALTLLAFVLLVVALTAFQSHRTRQVLDALRELCAPRAQVLRDGTLQAVSATELVPGDVVVVGEGARVPADGVLFEAHELSVDESLLSGESVPIAKSCDGTLPEPALAATRQLFFGSMVVQGQGRMIVSAIGGSTALGRIGASLGGITQAQSPLQLQARAFVNRFAIVALCLCVLLAVAYRWRTGEWVPALLAGITLAMGILPEEIPVIMTVFMALGARRIAAEGVLTRRLNAIETLGEVSVLCVDKTGTLTQNRMAVRVLFAQGQEQVVDDTLPELGEAYHELLEYLVLASEIEPFDPMERAFQRAGQRYLGGTEHLHGDWALVQEYALSPALPAMSHGWHAPDLSHYPVACKGAPEAICDLCHLDEAQTAALLERSAQMASRGLRVLGVARALHPGSEWPARQHDFEFSFVGLVGLLDPVRPEAAEAIAACRAAGIRVVMITGDYPTTAQAIAAEVGLDATRVVSGAALAEMDDAQLDRIIDRVQIFARIQPMQKLRLVDAFRRRGEVVAMTGDGVNDAPALKQADIGVAMGIKGTEAAKEIADMIITDDNFATIVSAVEQGRIIYANILKFIHYLLSCNFAEILTVFAAILIGQPLPLGALQILWLNMITDVFPALALALEPSAPDMMKRPPRDPRESLVGGQFLGLIAWQGAMLSALTLIAFEVGLRRYGGEPDGILRARTIAFLTLGFAQVVHAFNARSQRRSVFTSRLFTNEWLWAAVLTCVVLQVAAISAPPLRALLHTIPPTAFDWAVISACSLAPVAIVELSKLATRRRSRAAAPIKA
ncbi:MAG: cation-transporting P-type ATPase [Burkholderiales bacterium]|nr:cation-transporting P-type ATPase [Burkholderiales bacterium]